MLLEEMRQKVVDYGNQLISSGLTIGTAGNISMYDPETGYMVISPSGIPYAKQQQKMLSLWICRAILWTANAHLPVNTVYMLPFI